MPLTASFSDERRDLVQITVFRNNRPAFKIAPADAVPSGKGYLALANEVDSGYHDVFETLAHESRAN